MGVDYVVVLAKSVELRSFHVFMEALRMMPWSAMSSLRGGFSPLEVRLLTTHLGSSPQLPRVGESLSGVERGCGDGLVRNQLMLDPQVAWILDDILFLMAVALG